MVKFCQSGPFAPPAFGSCDMSFASSVVACSPVSVVSSGISVFTSIVSVAAPTDITAFTVEKPTMMVTLERSKDLKPSFSNFTL
jgi:hypothetical protein